MNAAWLRDGTAAARSFIFRISLHSLASLDLPARVSCSRSLIGHAMDEGTGQVAGWRRGASFETSFLPRSRARSATPRSLQEAAFMVRRAERRSRSPDLREVVPKARGIKFDECIFRGPDPSKMPEPRGLLTNYGDNPPHVVIENSLFDPEAWITKRGKSAPAHSGNPAGRLLQSQPGLSPGEAVGRLVHRPLSGDQVDLPEQPDHHRERGRLLRRPRRCPDLEGIEQLSAATPPCHPLPARPGVGSGDPP